MLQDMANPPDRSDTSQSATTKTILCPTNSKHHPTFSLTQLGTLSPPLTPDRHQTSTANPTSLPLAEVFSKSRNETFEASLWSLIPLSFRPQCSDTVPARGTPRETVSVVPLFTTSPLEKVIPVTQHPNQEQSPLDRDEIGLKSPDRATSDQLPLTAATNRALFYEDKNPFLDRQSQRDSKPASASFRSQQIGGKGRAQSPSPPPFFLRRRKSWDPEIAGNSATHLGQPSQLSPTSRKSKQYKLPSHLPFQHEFIIASDYTQDEPYNPMENVSVTSKDFWKEKEQQDGAIESSPKDETNRQPPQITTSSSMEGVMQPSNIFNSTEGVRRMSYTSEGLSGADTQELKTLDLGLLSEPALASQTPRIFEDELLENDSDGSESPTQQIEWLQSLESPVRPRTVGRYDSSPTTSTTPNIKGNQSSSLPEDPSVPSEFSGWSAALETPPRKSHLELKRRVSEGVLEKLRGVPVWGAKTPERGVSIASHDVSTASPKLARIHGVRSERKARVSTGGPPPFIDENIDLETILPRISDSHQSSQLVVEMSLSNGVSFASSPPSHHISGAYSLTGRQNNPNAEEIDSPIVQSQILPESQDDIFHGISDSAIDKMLLSRSDDSRTRRSYSPDSNDALVQAEEEQSQRHRRASNVHSTTLQDTVSSTAVAKSTNTVRGFRSASGKTAFKVSEERLNAARKLLGDDGMKSPILDDNITAGHMRGTSLSQEIDNGTLDLDPWRHSLSFGEDDLNEVFIKQEENDGSGIQLRPNNQNDNQIIHIEDDFDNIAFSQLDDGFGAFPDPTQIPRQNLSPTTSTSNSALPERKQRSTRLLSTSRLSPVEENLPHNSMNEKKPMKLSGFASASGKKLAPISKEALARAANLLGDEDVPPEENIGATSGQPLPLDPPSFSGFKSAGKKPLPPLSAAAREKASRLLQDSSEDAGTPEQPSKLTGIAASTIAKQIQPPQQKFGGFTSGSGAKLAPVPQGALNKWSKLFAGDEEHDGVPPSSLVQRPPSVSDESRTQAFPVAKATGFSSGSGKTLAPISKESQKRAYSVLEMEEAPLQRGALERSSRERLGNHGSTAGSGITDRSTSRPPQPPAISSHMNNLKRRRLGLSSAFSGSSGASLGMTRPVASKAKASFKSPLPFKPPLLSLGSVRSSASTSVTADTGFTAHRSDRRTLIASNDASHVLSKNDKGGRRLPMKPSTLHPKARALESSTATRSNVAQTVALGLTYANCSLFDMKCDGERTTLRQTLGSPHRFSSEKLLEMGVPQDVIQMNLDRARDYVFGEPQWGPQEAHQELVRRGANPELLTHWFRNHYQLIVWKLACYVRSWPYRFASRDPFFSPSKVIEQLCYRYEREVNRAERPALRKIVEGDESAARHMVLCIAKVASHYSEETQRMVTQVLVTDGWYLLPAVLDPHLSLALEKGRLLKIGTKIHVCRAKINGLENGGVSISELSVESSPVSIVLQANGTRLASWEAKLGFQRKPTIWTSRIQSIMPEGGLIPGLDVIVLRKYPVFFLESLDNGATKVKRTAREEEIAVEAHQERIQKRYQDIVQEIEREFGGESRLEEGIRSLKVEDEIQERTKGLMQEDSLNRDIASLIAKKTSRDFGTEGLVQLSGTRGSTAMEMPVDPEMMLLTPFQPREITTCAEVQHLYAGAEMDLAVIILAVLDNPNLDAHFSGAQGGLSRGLQLHGRAYMVVTDSSRQLVLVEYQLSSANSGATATIPGNSTLSSRATAPSILKASSLVLLQNARYKAYDHKFGLAIVSCPFGYSHMITATPLSSSGALSGTNDIMGGVPSSKTRSTTSRPSYAQSALQRLDEMMASQHNNHHQYRGRPDNSSETLLDLMARANNVLEKMQQPTL
ncbi:Breast cancer 2, early onset [Lunasporangiospora selenospora]|uniref:Breast cancer 2, early onset n=1 Tax=Lunasporangiospora selenospora TaxID=979761 RepID=A0A9P6KIT6_9FUNG|nr:Breast cancer 2, early onset [Lunasporangiospora selenospora]